MKILVKLIKIGKPTDYILNISMLSYPIESINIFRQKLDTIDQISYENSENLKTTKLKSMSL